MCTCAFLSFTIFCGLPFDLNSCVVNASNFSSPSFRFSKINERGIRRKVERKPLEFVGFSEMVRIESCCWYGWKEREWEIGRDRQIMCMRWRWIYNIKEKSNFPSKEKKTTKTKQIMQIILDSPPHFSYYVRIRVCVKAEDNNEYWPIAIGSWWKRFCGVSTKGDFFRYIHANQDDKMRRKIRVATDGHCERTEREREGTKNLKNSEIALWESANDSTKWNGRWRRAAKREITKWVTRSHWKKRMEVGVKRRQIEKSPIALKENRIRRGNGKMTIKEEKRN